MFSTPKFDSALAKNIGDCWPFRNFVSSKGSTQVSTIARSSSSRPWAASPSAALSRGSSGPVVCTWARVALWAVRSNRCTTRSPMA